MSQVLKFWVAFAALGAGVLHLALVPGSPLPVALALLPLGVAELGWGVAVLAKGTFVLAKLARAVALAPLLLWAALLLVSGLFKVPQLTAAPSLIPMAVATLFNFAIAMVLTLSLRRDRTPDATPQHSNAWGQLGGLFAGGLVVSLMMTPALTFTVAGLNNPHANHGPATSDQAPATNAFTPEFFDHSGH